MLRISSRVLLLSCFIGSYSLSLGETVQDLGLPGAVKTEVVFPYVAWGSLEGYFHITELILINPNEEGLHFELQLFTSDGKIAKEFLESYVEVAGIDGELLEDGKVQGFVPKNYVYSWNLSPWALEDEFFSGWLLVRADRELQTHLRYTVFETEENVRFNIVSISDLTASYQNVQSARYSVDADKYQI